MRGHSTVERGRGLGPFTGAQLTVVIVAICAVFALPMIASAAIPNGNTVNACADKKTGALRAIDSSKGQKCKATETKLSWPSAPSRVIQMTGKSSQMTLSGAGAFIGPTAKVTLASNQSLALSMTAKVSSAGGADVGLTMCQAYNGGVSYFDDYYTTPVGSDPQNITVTQSISGFAGTHTFGLCAFGSGTLDASFNGFANVQGYLLISSV